MGIYDYDVRVCANALHHRTLIITNHHISLWNNYDDFMIFTLDWMGLSKFHRLSTTALSVPRHKIHLQIHPLFMTSINSWFLICNCISQPIDSLRLAAASRCIHEPFACVDLIIPMDITYIYINLFGDSITNVFYIQKLIIYEVRKKDKIVKYLYLFTVQENWNEENREWKCIYTN